MALPGLSNELAPKFAEGFLKSVSSILNPSVGAGHFIGSTPKEKAEAQGLLAALQLALTGTGGFPSPSTQPIAQATEIRRKQISPTTTQRPSKTPKPSGKRNILDIILRDVLLPGGAGFIAGRQENPNTRALLQALGSILSIVLTKKNIEREARNRVLAEIANQNA